MEVPFETFSEFLNWLFSPSMGGFAILTWFASWALEDAKWWHELSSKVRSIIFYAISVVIGIGAYLLVQNEALVTAVDPYFKILLAATSVWLSTQIVHKIDKAVTPEEETPDEPFG